MKTGAMMPLEERLDRIEAAQMEICADLLGYLRADISIGWMVSAKRLEATLCRVLDKDVGLCDLKNRHRT